MGGAHQKRCELTQLSDPSTDSLSIDPTALILEGVRFLGAAEVGAHCVLGQRGAGSGDHPPELVIGPDATIRSGTILYAGTVIGSGLQTGHRAFVREANVIGDGVKIGTNAVLEWGNRIGDGVRIHAGCFLEMTEVGEGAFIGPHVVFSDDPHPACPRYQDCKGGGVVGRYASIGANATILPGVVIGERALVGAGSVVTRSVEPGDVVVGNPARPLGRRDELGASLGSTRPLMCGWVRRRRESSACSRRPRPHLSLRQRR